MQILLPTEQQIAAASIMSVLRSSHPNVALPPLISPAAATSSSSTSTSLAHRLLNKKNPTHTPLTPLNSPSPLRARALSAWSTIFTAHPVTQISHRPNLLASAHEPTLPQLSILLPTVNEPPSKMTVGKRITFSESVVFSSPTPRRTFSSSSTSTDPGKPHFTLPVPISSSVLCKIAESIEAPTSDSIGNPDKKLPPSTISAYEFLVAGSWAPKPRVDYGALLVATKENRKDFFRKKTIADDEFAFDATIPKIMKTQKVDAGEDAFFGTKLQNYVALGVADGVGGWVLSGVDPSEFAWSLMNNVAATATKSLSKPVVDESVILEPIDLLEMGYAQVANQREVAAGGSTACILTLCAKSGMLRSANLGDSSFLIIRDLSNVIYQPTEQQHFFNCPYQLTIVPPHERKKYKKKILSPSLTLHAPNSTHDADPANPLDAMDYDDDPTMPSNPNIKLTRPRDADIWQESLKHGDVVVLATDGFFDNVDVTNECIPVVRKTLARWIAEGGLEKTTESDDKAYQMARACAKKLTELAVSHQNDPHRMTPFAKKALIHGVHYRGGKIDDVTVLVAIVRRTG